MKKLILLILLTHVLGSSSAQKSTIEWGEPFSDNEQIVLYGTDGNGYYGLDLAGKDLHLALVRFDKDLKEIERIDPGLETRIKGAEYFRVISFNGKFVIFSSFYDSRKKMNSLYAQYLNTKGEFEKEPKLIHEVPAKDKDNTPNYRIKLNQDSSAILLRYSTFHSREKKEAGKFFFRLLDDNLEPIWEKEMELEYDDPFQIENYLVDKNPRLYIVARMDERRETIEEKDEKKKRAMRKTYNARYRITIYNQETDNISDIDPNAKGSLKEKTITEIDMAVEDNNLILTGFYSDTGSRLNGFFIVKFDVLSARLLLENVEEFEQALFRYEKAITVDTKERKKKKRATTKGVAQHYENHLIRDNISNADGSRFIVAEHYISYAVTSTVRNPNGTTSTTFTPNYIFGDILVLKLDKTGRVMWKKKVPKYQHTAKSAKFSSFCFLMNDGNLCFIFNDNPVNMDSESPIIYNIYSGSSDYKNIPVLVTMTTEGQVSKSTIEDKNPDPKKAKSTLYPYKTLTIGGTIILERSSGKTNTFGKLDLN